MNVRLPLLGLGMAALMTACLAETKTGTNDTTAPSDTSIQDADTHIDSDTPDRCFGVDCDDNNPCTTDTCTEAACGHTVIAGCLVGCTAEGTIPVESVFAQGPTDFVKTVGTLTAHPLFQTCNDGAACDCIGYPGLAGENRELILTIPETFGIWNCETTGCVSTRCEPVQLGVRYRVWGRSITEWEAANGMDRRDPDRTEAPEAGAIAVTDFCLETTASSLAGDYVGTWAHGGVSYTIEATIKADATLAITERCAAVDEDCPLGGFTFDLPLEFGDGYVDIITSSTSPFQQPDGAPVRLYSQQNTLTGSYVAVDIFSGGGSDVATINGNLLLERQAPTSMSVQP